MLGVGSDILSDGAAPLLATDLLAEGGDLLAENREVVFRKVLAAGPDLIYEVEGFDELIVIAPGDPGMPEGGVLVATPGDSTWDGPAAPLRLSRLKTILSLGADHGYPMPRLAGLVAIGAGDDCARFGAAPGPEAVAAAKRAASAAMEILCEDARHAEVG